MIELTDLQLKQLAEFVSNLGLVFFATVVTPIFTEPDRFNIFATISGILLTIICVIISLIILKGIKHGKS